MLKLLSSAEVEKLGPYELVGQLASGGMATVFLARRAGLGGFSRYVAIKRLRPEISKAPAFLAMLIDEARLAARIHHPNVAATLEFSDAGEAEVGHPLGDQGQFYLVMEYVEGGSLLDLVSRSTSRSEVLPPKVVVRIVLDALAGLHAAHELHDDQGKPIDLVHRDLSPHNLMIGLDGCTRVVDFGLARAASRLTKTAVGTLKGKLAYMAPEQLHQRPLDRRADLFSVGVVLWEGLSGERLFRAETDVGTIERVLRGEIPSLRTALPWLSPALDKVVLRALARDPDARFQTAEEMSLALSEAAEEVGLMGSRREVGACVARVLGDELAERRALIRTWLDARGAVDPPSSTQLSFAGLAAAAGAWADDRVESSDSETIPGHGDDPVAAVRGSVIGAPGALSIAPLSSSAPKARRRRRRTIAPLVAGAAIGMGAIALALFARAGGHVPLLHGAAVEVATPAAQIDATPREAPRVDQAESKPEAEAEPTVLGATMPADEVAAAPEATPAPTPHDAPSATVDAKPEPRSEPAPATAPRPRTTSHGPSSRHAPRTSRPARAEPPIASAPAPKAERADKPAKPRDLDNPYR